MDVEKLGKIVISTSAIVVLGVICIYALSLGIDASLVGGISAIIGGIAGYKIAIKRK